MKPSELYSLIQFKGNIPSDTAPWTAANILLVVNNKIDKLAQAIAQVNPDYFGEVSTTDTVANQQEYTMPSDLLLFKRMDISYSDTNPGSYHPARKVNLSQLKPQGEDYYAKYQSTSDPLVRLDDTGLFTYPEPQTGTTGTAFIRLWYVPQRTHLPDLTNSTTDIATTTGITQTFHEMLIEMVVDEIKEKKGEITPLDVQTRQQNILDVLVPAAFKDTSTPNSELPNDIQLQL